MDVCWDGRKDDGPDPELASFETGVSPHSLISRLSRRVSSTPSYGDDGSLIRPCKLQTEKVCHTRPTAYMTLPTDSTGDDSKKILFRWNFAEMAERRVESLIRRKTIFALLKPEIHSMQKGSAIFVGHSGNIVLWTRDTMGQFSHGEVRNRQIRQTRFKACEKNVSFKSGWC
jgi:hypothetical protein